MRLHDIEEDDLPYKIRLNLEKYKKSLNKKSVHHLDTETTKPGKKSLSTGRKPIKHKIDTNISHVSVVGGDMITVRNKDKKVDIKKGLEDSLVDSLSSKSKSNTRNKSKESSSKNNMSCSNGDSMKALDDIMPIPVKKASNQNFVLKKQNIKFKPLRTRLKNKPQRQDKLNITRDTSEDYKSLPQKLSENTEQTLTNGRLVKQSRNKVIEAFAPAELNNMISNGKPVLKNNFFA